MNLQRGDNSYFSENLAYFNNYKRLKNLKRWKNKMITKKLLTDKWEDDVTSFYIFFAVFKLS